MGLRLDEVLDAIGSHPDFAKVDLFALQEASIHDGRPDAEAVAEAGITSTSVMLSSPAHCWR